ncbi:substrate-binding domain-containing protein [Trinickia sp. LjRoot230]|uniref:substrate-binding domain-containing protein n=1 Tax=Trinickia sp. LjRoot230 TaxID=3342288 RepID=UPI003ECC81DC
MRDSKRLSAHIALSLIACCCAALASAAVHADGAALPNNDGADGVLRVCADPHNMPLSNDKGEGYENKIAEQMAHDFGYKVEYTYFPQRIGFVRHTLREKEASSERFKCDLIVGVPKGYDLTSTTHAYLHSTYAMVLPNKPEFATVKTPDDLLKLPPAELKKLRFGIFAQTPAVDWLLAHGLIDQAMSYQVQSGDPQAYPGEMIEHDLASGNVDVAFVWGPIAGYFAKRSGDAVKIVPFPPQKGIRFDYQISMGVRHGEKAWHDKVDQWISTNQDKIDQILTSYSVPLLKPVDAEVPKQTGSAQ